MVELFFCGYIMVDLNLLKNLIQQSNQTPSEKFAEESFDQIVDFIEEENTHEAAKLIEKVFAKQVPDIRLIVYYFYAHFADHGIQSFEQTLPLLTSLVNDHCDLLTPKVRIDKHVQNSLNWFFSQVLLRLKYCEKLHHSGKLHPIWKKSVMETSLEDINRLLHAVEKFETFFLEKWPQSPTKDRVLHLVKKIEEIKVRVSESEKALLLAQANKEKLEEVPLIEEALELPSEKQPLQEDLQDSTMHSEEIKEDFANPADTLLDNSQWASAPHIENERRLETQNQLSPPSIDKDTFSFFIGKLEHLTRKLKVFEILIEKNDYLKASVVAQDIDYLIKNFDPLEYFPKLFGSYFSLFAKHVNALSKQYENRDAMQVQALKKLYLTDLEMFLDW